MGGYTVRQIDEMQAINNGFSRRAAAELGVESFGMQVFDMPPNFSDYPVPVERIESVERELGIVRHGPSPRPVKSS